jgi:hypothetical protein
MGLPAGMGNYFVQLKFSELLKIRTIVKHIKSVQMKKFCFLIISLFVSYIVISQVSPDKYWVKFTDKNNSPYSIDNPGEYLSLNALERRVLHGIDIVENDLPVNPQYIQAVTNIGVTVLTVSKWFNSVTIYTTDMNALDEIGQLSFVESVVKGNGDKNEIQGNESLKPFFANETYSDIPGESILKSITSGNSYNYGSAYNQIHMLNGDILHDMGFDGEGKTIAVLDAGFLNADNIDAFDSLWNNGQILGNRDFVSPLNPDIFGSHYHGTMVLSTMGANLPGQIVGTAPKADYWLIRTEDGSSEYLIEELNWVSGAEFADSVGADIINSSLGYTTFDDPSQDHSYEDMNGNSAPVTIGADIAVSKGMIVVNSAGNSGGSSWQYIGAPADGDSVFSIGAVDNSGNYASFSSTGPTYDGRVKPNVVAQGQGTAIVDPSGQVGNGSGTSFSSPITAGMVACLWQANPSKRNTEIMEAIQMSATQANNPDGYLGYGIPDYVIANSILTVVENQKSPVKIASVYPNPFVKDLSINVYDESQAINKIEFTDIAGKILFSQSFIDNNKTVRLNDLKSLPAGFYLLRITLNNKTETHKVLKK